MTAFAGRCQVCPAEHSRDCTDPNNPSCYVVLTHAAEQPVGTIMSGVIDSRYSYESEISIGQRYRHGGTGFEGVATEITFFEHGCELVTLKTLVNHNIVQQKFPGPSLTKINKPEKVGFNE